MPDIPVAITPSVSRVLQRIRQRRDQRSDHTFVREPGPYPEVAEELFGLYQAVPFDPGRLLDVGRARRAEGRLTEITWQEWQFKAAAHPQVQRWHEAERALERMEREIEKLDEYERARPQAAVERHRSWMAYQQRDLTRALEHGLRAYELNGWVTDLHNILCVLVRCGEDGAARALLTDAEHHLPEDELHQLHTMGAKDPDLATLLT